MGRSGVVVKRPAPPPPPTEALRGRSAPGEPRATRVRAVLLLYRMTDAPAAGRFLDGLSHFGLRALDLRIADLRAEGKLP